MLAWLLAVASAAGSTKVYAQVAAVAKAVGFPELLSSPNNSHHKHHRNLEHQLFSSPYLTKEEKSSIEIPAYVASLNSAGSAFFVQVIVWG